MVREVTAAKLYDVGPVTFPAYDATTAGTRDEGEFAEARSSLESFKASNELSPMGDTEQRQRDLDRQAQLEAEV